jgi:S-adenosylmethionine hydrolase
MANEIRTDESINIGKVAGSSINIMDMAISGRNVELMLRRDVKEFRDRIDFESIVEAEAVKKRFIVVDQFPNAGVQVPAGTPINLTFMYKDQIDIGIIKDMSPEMMNKYKDDKVRKVIDDISSNTEAKKALESDKKYEDLSTEEKKAVKKYVIEKEILTAEASEEKISGVYKDLHFIYNF